MTLSRREPARLVNTDSTDEFTRRLLRSANVDQPPSRALDRAMVHVTALVAEELAAESPARQLSGQTTARIRDVAQRSKTRSSRFRSMRVTRAAGFGFLLGTSVAAAVVGVTQNATREPQPTLIGPVNSAPKAKRSSKLAGRTAPSEVEQVNEAPALSSVSPPREVKQPRPSNSDLSQELALLDTAKLVLSQGNPNAALRALDDTNKLSRRVLIPEATVLRVRALVALKRTAQARQLVEDFVAQAPHSPVNPLLRALVAPSEKR